MMIVIDILYVLMFPQIYIFVNERTCKRNLHTEYKISNWNFSILIEKKVKLREKIYNKKNDFLEIRQLWNSWQIYCFFIQHVQRKKRKKYLIAYFLSFLIFLLLPQTYIKKTRRKTFFFQKNSSLLQMFDLRKKKTIEPPKVTVSIVDLFILLMI